MTDKEVLLKILTDRPIAFHPDISKATKSINAGVFLSQLLYWTGKQKDRAGWIYKTQDEFYEETALSRRNQENARSTLKRLGVLVEKRRGVPARLHYKINFDKLTEIMKIYYNSVQSENVQNEQTEIVQPVQSKNVQNEQSEMYESSNLYKHRLHTENTKKYQRERDQQIKTENEKLINQIRIVSGLSFQKIKELIKKYGETEILESIKICKKNRKSYLEAVLRNREKDRSLKDYVDPEKKSIKFKSKSKFDIVERVRPFVKPQYYNILESLKEHYSTQDKLYFMIGKISNKIKNELQKNIGEALQKEVVLFVK